MFRQFAASRILLFRKVPAIPPINSVHIVGVAHDVSNGFVGDEAVTQFQLTVAYTPIDNAAPQIHPSSSASSAAGASSGNAVTTPTAPREKENFTVRCWGGLPPETKATLYDGAVVSVRGALRVNVQPEPSAGEGKSFPFPFISVRPGAAGSMVEVLGKGATTAASAGSAASSTRHHHGKQRR